jgi:hypothetical protein
MTTDTSELPPPPPPEEEPAPPPPQDAGPTTRIGRFQAAFNRRKKRVSVTVGVVVLVVGAYTLSLFAVHYLQKSAGPLPPLDLSEGGGNYTVVQLRLDELKTTANRLTVDVLVYPPDSVYDQRFDVLAKDVAVRLYPTSDLGDLVFPVGKAPAQVQTKIEAHGDPGNWPLQDRENLGRHVHRSGQRTQKVSGPRRDHRRVGRLGRRRGPGYRQR